HRICLLVIFKAFGFGVPFQLASAFDGNIGEMAYSGNAVADVDREIRVFATFDALEKVIVLAFEVGIEMNFFGPNDRIENLIGTGLDFAAPAVVADPALCADEFDTRIAGFAGHDDTVGVTTGNVVILYGIEQAAFPIGAGTFNLNRAGAFRIIGP